MHALFSDVQHDQLVIASNFIVSIFYGIINQLVTMMIPFCTLVEVNFWFVKGVLSLVNADYRNRLWIHAGLNDSLNPSLKAW